MQRPKCRLCGALHYANEPHADFDKLDTKHSLRSYATKSVASRATRPVATFAVASDATPAVACPECKRLRSELKKVRAEASAEIEALHGEVAMLKRARAGTDKVPLTATERSRRLRAKRKADSGRIDFEG